MASHYITPAEGRSDSYPWAVVRRVTDGNRVTTSCIVVTLADSDSRYRTTGRASLALRAAGSSKKSEMKLKNLIQILGFEGKPRHYLDEVTDYTVGDDVVHFAQCLHPGELTKVINTGLISS